MRRCFSPATNRPSSTDTISWWTGRSPAGAIGARSNKAMSRCARPSIKPAAPIRAERFFDSQTRPSGLLLLGRFLLQIWRVDGRNGNPAGAGERKRGGGFLVFHDFRHHGLPCAIEHRAVLDQEFLRLA